MELVMNTVIKMTSKRKLGLIGLLLTGVMTAVGCVSAKNRIENDIIELEKELYKNKAEAQRKYWENLEKTRKETAKEVNASLKAERDRAYAEAEESDEEKIKQAYEKANDLMQERKEAELANLEAKQRE